MKLLFVILLLTIVTKNLLRAFGCANATPSMIEGTDAVAHMYFNVNGILIFPSLDNYLNHLSINDTNTTVTNNSVPFKSLQVDAFQSVAVPNYNGTQSQSAIITHDSLINDSVLDKYTVVVDTSGLGVETQAQWHLFMIGAAGTIITVYTIGKDCARKLTQMKNLSSSLVITGSIIVFLAAHSKDNDTIGFGTMMAKASIIYGFCKFVEEILKFKYMNSQKNYIFLSHFGNGIVSFVAYVGLYYADKDNWMDHFAAIFLGYYVYTLMIILKKDKYSKDMKLSGWASFYQIHHCGAFFMKSLWRFMEEDWSPFMIRSTVCWLSSDVYLYCNNFYLAANGKEKAFPTFCRNQKYIFFVERLQRMAAYFQALAHMHDENGATIFTFFHWTVLVCIISIDIYDAVKQNESIHTNAGKLESYKKKRHLH